MRVGLVRSEPHCRAVGWAVFQGTSPDSLERLFQAPLPRKQGWRPSLWAAWEFLPSESRVRVPPSSCQNQTPNAVSSARRPRPASACFPSGTVNLQPSTRLGAGVLGDGDMAALHTVFAESSSFLSPFPSSPVPDALVPLVAGCGVWNLSSSGWLSHSPATASAVTSHTWPWYVLSCSLDLKTSLDWRFGGVWEERSASLLFRTLVTGSPHVLTENTGKDEAGPELGRPTSP